MSLDLGESETSAARAALRATGSSRVVNLEKVQALWSDYGQLLRCTLEGGTCEQVVVKMIDLKAAAEHPRGWNTTRSHERKKKSYRIEQCFYQNYARRCEEADRVPRCLWSQSEDDRQLLVLEDLDAAGYSLRRARLSEIEFDSGLRWLATFHARFLGTETADLWQTGTYWHLETRPDELAKLEEGPLKEKAQHIDRVLSEARYRSLVHGDAKVANFCFSNSRGAAAVDFQYVGGGVGVKDLAYFLSSCLSGEECQKRERKVLDAYFNHLTTELKRLKPEVEPCAVEKEWRELYPFAWADFVRFLRGWSPSHWKLHGYSTGITEKVLKQL